MTDPYPEERRRRRLQNDGLQRDAAGRPPHERGPSADRVNEALEAVASHDIPGTPPVSELKVLKQVHSSEWRIENRRVRYFSITPGDPQHGAMRSDTHVGRYEVEVPIAEIGVPGIGSKCPECGHRRALYRYRTHHNIAGSESVFCLRCEEKLHGEDWG